MIFGAPRAQVLKEISKYAKSNSELSPFFFQAGIHIDHSIGTPSKWTKQQSHPLSRLWFRYLRATRLKECVLQPNPHLTRRCRKPLTVRVQNLWIIVRTRIQFVHQRCCALSPPFRWIWMEWELTLRPFICETEYPIRYQNMCAPETPLFTLFANRRI